MEPKTTKYECTRCKVSKPREDFPGKKRRNSWCKPCVKEQRLERQDRMKPTRPVVVGDEWDIEDTFCQCGGGVYLHYSDAVCAQCGRVYRAPKPQWIGRPATEEEIAAAVAR